MNDVKKPRYELDIFVKVKMLIKYMYTNAKIRIYPVGIYLLKVNNENSKTRCVI